MFRALQFAENFNFPQSWCWTIAFNLGFLEDDISKIERHIFMLFAVSFVDFSLKIHLLSPMAFQTDADGFKASRQTKSLRGKDKNEYS